MTAQEFKRQAVEALEKDGTKLDPAILKRAMDKVRRHMRNKYGELDWQAELDESEFNNVWSFYSECRAAFNDPRSFNRQVAQARRT